jgi:Ser/Thr protein kinase RdoA (MazF antagonist)
MTDVDARAQRAAQAWGGVVAPPRLVGARENAVFEARLTDGQRVALRLHRPGYQTRSAIEAELRWTEALGGLGFPCPRPIRSRDGGLVHALADGQLASAVSWIDATPIGAGGDAFAGSLAEQEALYHRLGALTRRLHDMTDQIETAGFDRPRWDLPGLLGEAPHWGKFWENPALSEAEADLLQTARRHAAQQLNEISRLDIGLIHADLLQENVLCNADGLHIIDFDDSGFGYRLFDLGVALVQHEGRPELPALTDSLCDGYGCGTEHMPLFMMLRGFASCGWVIPRLAHDDPGHRRYADRALRCATAFLNS